MFGRKKKDSEDKTKEICDTNLNITECNIVEEIRKEQDKVRSLRLKVNEVKRACSFNLTKEERSIFEYVFYPPYAYGHGISGNAFSHAFYLFLEDDLDSIPISSYDTLGNACLALSEFFLTVGDHRKALKEFETEIGASADRIDELKNNIGIN